MPPLDSGGLPIEFDINDSITGAFVGSLDFDNWGFNDPLGGVGSFSGDIPLKNSKAGELIGKMTTPWRYAVYARWKDFYLWGGPISGRTWNRSSGTLTISGAQWEGWFYKRLLQKKFVKFNTEQFSIVRTLISQMIADSGCPQIVLPSSANTIARDVAFDPWTSYGDILDDLANRDPGFDWSIQIRKSAQTGLPQLYMQLWYPERRSVDQTALLFESTIDDDNLVSGGNAALGEWPEDAGDVVSRQWATGVGSPPDQPVANDEDPALGDGTVLLTEAATNYGSTLKRVALQEYAAEERRYRGVPLQTVSLDISGRNPDVRDYFTGDRARLTLNDRWLNIDLPGVRIVDRAIRGGRAGSGVTVVLDVNEFEAPDNGEGVDPG